MSSFQDLRLFRSQYSPQTEALGSYAHALSMSSHLTRHARNSFRLLAQDYCERKNPKLLKRRHLVSYLYCF